MTDRVSVRCPYPNCKCEFLIDNVFIEAAIRCEMCRRPMTARTVEVWRVLEERDRAHHTNTVAFTRAEPIMRNRSPIEVIEELNYEPSPDMAQPRRPANPNRIVILDDVRSQWNVGAIFRTVDGMGWGRAVLCGITATPPAKMISKTALGAETYTPWKYYASALIALDDLRCAGFTVVALEQTADAKPFKDITAPEKMALIVGNEVRGISAEVLAICTDRISIPMVGRKASLNLAVAFGILAVHFA